MANLILSLKISVTLLCILFINGLNGSDAREDSKYEVESLENLEKTAKNVSLKLANKNRRIRRNENDENDDNDNDDINNPTKDKFWEDYNLPDFLASENKDNLDTTEAPIPLTTMTEEKKKKGTCTASHKKKTTTSGKSCDCGHSNTTTTRIYTRTSQKIPIPDHPVTIGYVKSNTNRRTKRCPHGIYYRKGCRICYCLPKRKFCESVYTSEDCAYWAAKIHCEASRLMYQYNVKCEGPCECKSYKDPLKTVTTCARLPCHNAVLEQYGVLETNDTQLAARN